jgi:hypothetical protein
VLLATLKSRLGLAQRTPGPGRGGSDFSEQQHQRARLATTGKEHRRPTGATALRTADRERMLSVDNGFAGRNF